MFGKAKWWVCLLRAAVAFGFVVPLVSSSADATVSPAPIPLDREYGVNDVLCASSRFCAVVDDGGYAATWNGSIWSRSASIDPTGSLSSVSCTSAAFCIAVGGASVKGSTPSAGTAVQWNGSSWSPSASIDPEALSTVSCISPTQECLAAGSISTVTFNDGAWSNPEEWPEPSDLVDDQPSALSCVSALLRCRERRRCRDLHGVCRRIDPSLPDEESIDSSGDLESVSCPSSSFCVAIDGSGNAVVMSSGIWSHPVRVLSSAGDDGVAPSVSCASSSFCVVVSDTGATIWNGSAWSAAQTMDALPSDVGTPPRGVNHSVLDSVSCVSSTFCVAADNAGRMFTWNGSSWSAPQIADPNGTLIPRCPSPGDLASASICSYRRGVLRSGRSHCYYGTQSKVLLTVAFTSERNLYEGLSDKGRWGRWIGWAELHPRCPQPA